MKLEKNQDLERYELKDYKSNGEERPWREKKMLNVSVANSFKRSALTSSADFVSEKLIKKADSIRNCGTWLEFIATPDGDYKKLFLANFCKNRMCPMCQWRRSLRVFSDLSKVMNIMQTRTSSNNIVFLTLTLKSCEGSELSSTISNLLDGWKKLFRMLKFKRNFIGWFRALEITYDDITETFHPHIHAILFCKKSYFYKSNKEYMHTADWVQAWKKILNVDYDPICDIRAVKGKKKKDGSIDNSKAVLEVSKYTVKMDFVQHLEKLRELKEGAMDFDEEVEYMHQQTKIDNALLILAEALHGRRLYAYGGELKKIANELNCNDVEKANLIHIDDDNNIREDLMECIEVYHWNFGWGNYYKANKAEREAEREQQAEEHKIKCKLIQDEIQAIKEIDENIILDKIKEKEKWTEV